MSMWGFTFTIFFDGLFATEYLGEDHYDYYFYYGYR